MCLPLTSNDSNSRCLLPNHTTYFTDVPHIKIDRHYVGRTTTATFRSDSTMDIKVSEWAAGNKCAGKKWAIDENGTITFDDNGCGTLTITAMKWRSEDNTVTYTSTSGKDGTITTVLTQPTPHPTPQPTAKSVSPPTAKPTAATVVTPSPTPRLTEPSPADDDCGGQWDQCGGASWDGATCCKEGYTCTAQDEYYSQCL